jgi:hypothetical protein
MIPRQAVRGSTFSPPRSFTALRIAPRWGCDAPPVQDDTLLPTNNPEAAEFRKEAGSKMVDEKNGSLLLTLFSILTSEF